MAKLKLDPERLEVDSFAVNPHPPRARGTVQAREVIVYKDTGYSWVSDCTFAGDCTGVESAAASCPVCQPSVNDIATCAGTCQTCADVATCYVTCQTCP